MQVPINLYLTVLEKSSPIIAVKINDIIITDKVDTSIINEHGHVPVSFVAELTDTNIIELCVTNNIGGNVVLSEAVVGDIKLSLALFLSTKNHHNNTTTTLTSDGVLRVTIETPIWQWWCEKMQSFNYDDYSFT